MKIDSRNFGFGIIKRACFFFLFILSTCAVNAQRLDVGFTYDLVGFNPTRFPSDFFFGEATYKAYYIHKMQCPWGPQNNMALDLVVDYNKFFVMGKLALNGSLLYGIKYKYTYPVGYDAFKTYYSRVTSSQTDISGSFGYAFNSRRFLRPYVEIGFGRSAIPVYREDMSDKKNFYSLWSGRSEMRNYLGLDKPFNYLLVGYGYRGDLFSLSARYKIRLGKHDVFFSNLSLGMSVFSRFSKLRKHYIYQPEE